MPRRVAITIAGAVSLGAYEAGVMYELLEAFRQHNNECDEQANPDGKIYVDVITGASAGGMTAAMLAESLMFRGASLTGAEDNPLYNAWVKRITLKGLVKLGRKEPIWNSLFSSDLITRIGTEMLVTPMDTPPTGPHACLEPGAPLRIGMALTNLDGVDYMIPIEGIKEGGFNYTSSVDQRLFVVYPGQTPKLEILTQDGTLVSAKWSDLRAVAVACGAFPFAFRPQEIQREKDEFVNAVTPAWPGLHKKTKLGTTYVTPKPAPKKDKWSFAYTDGGVLQNQPLGIAKDLVDSCVKQRLSAAKVRAAAAPNEQAAAVAHTEIGNAHRDAHNRIYVFVSPNEVKSSAITAEAPKINLAKMVPDIVSVYLRQAVFHDWITAEGVNQQIEILDTRATDLATALLDGKVQNVSGLFQASDNLNNLLLGDNKEAAYERLTHQYIDLVRQFAPDQQIQVDAFIAGIATLEAAADLGDRDKMHIIAVLADGKRELAGSGLASFVGFFSQTYREHDYRVGRIKAREYLQRKDVSGLLDLNVALLSGFYSLNPIPPLGTALTVPVKLWTALKAGGRWLFYSVWLRAKKLLIALAAVVTIIVYLAVAHHYRWWPF